MVAFRFHWSWHFLQGFTKSHIRSTIICCRVFTWSWLVFPNLGLDVVHLDPWLLLHRHLFFVPAWHSRTIDIR